MPSDKERALILIEKRAEQMSDELTVWAKEELLLAPGQKVLVTLTIEDTPVVEIQYDPQDKVFNGIPTAKDWEEIFSLPWGLRKTTYRGQSTEWCLERLKEMQASKTHSTKNATTYQAPDFNNFFKKYGDKFRTYGDRYSLTMRVAR